MMATMFSSVHQIITKRRLQVSSPTVWFGLEHGFI